MRNLFLPLLLTGLTLAGCSKSSDDAKPAAETHTLQARISGADLTGLGAAIYITEERDFINGGTVKVRVQEALPGTTAAKTYELGTYGPEDLISAEIYFRNVTRSSSLRPRAGSRLSLALLADGKIVEQTELNSTATGWKVSYDPFLKGGADCETDNL